MPKIDDAQIKDILRAYFRHIPTFVVCDARIGYGMVRNEDIVGTSINPGGTWLYRGAKMPYVARLYVKTSLVYLILTFLVGASMLLAQAFGRPAPPILWIEHAHAGFVGWLVNMVIGIALWLLPLNRKRFPNTQGRYPESLARASYYLLNLGLAARLIAEPWSLWHPGGLPAAALAAAALSQVVGVAIFGWIAWQRIVAPSLRADV